jgi:hypothetical protein
MTAQQNAWQGNNEEADAQYCDRLTNILGEGSHVSILPEPKNEFTTFDPLGLAVIVLAVLVLLYL